MTHASRPERIGLLGGSFDPVHVGHIALARAAQTALQLDAIRFIPTARSWQKQHRQTDAGHRIAMLREAIASHPDWRVDDRETCRGGDSYTIDTLASLRGELGTKVALVLIIGSDQLQNLASWHRWQELTDFCHIAATQRETVGLHDFPAAVEAFLETHGRDALSDTAAGDVVFFRMPAVAVSSTRLRAAIRRHEPVAELLPHGVAHYIALNDLYRQEP